MVGGLTSDFFLDIYLDIHRVHCELHHALIVQIFILIFIWVYNIIMLNIMLSIHTATKRMGTEFRSLSRYLPGYSLWSISSSPYVLQPKARRLGSKSLPIQEVEHNKLVPLKEKRNCLQYIKFPFNLFVHEQLN